MDIISIRGYASDRLNAEALPESVQLFPPGKIEGGCLDDQGKSVSFSCTITAKTAELLKRDFDALVASAKAGNGTKPYLDINHDDREASALVHDVFWAGEDPRTGGVRAKVEWTAAGKEAITGKNYQAFSPSFRYDTKNHEVIGLDGVNMGGLVNRPAIRNIQKFFARDGDNQNNKPKSMNKLHEALVAAGLLATMPTDEAAATIDFNNRWTPLKGKLAAIETIEGELDTTKASLKAKETEFTALKVKHDGMMKANAETLAIRAAEAGLYPPKDEASKADWIEAAKENPERVTRQIETALKAKAAAGGSVTQTIIAGQRAAAGAATGSDAEKYVTLVRAKSGELFGKIKSHKTEAIQAINSAHPELLKAYREAGAPALF